MKSNLKNARLPKRLATYKALSSELALQSDKSLENLLKTAKSMGSNIGGTTSLLTLDQETIFVKKNSLN